jgi:hypothetical protein
MPNEESIKEGGRERGVGAGYVGKVREKERLWARRKK